MWRFANSQTATKIWLRYYLEQLFGVQWRKYGRRYTRRRKKFPDTDGDEPNEATDYDDCNCTEV